MDSFCVATALTVYGIETWTYALAAIDRNVATALTVYGIETNYIIVADLFGDLSRCNSSYRLRY